MFGYRPFCGCHSDLYHSLVFSFFCGRCLTWFYLKIIIKYVRISAKVSVFSPVFFRPWTQFETITIISGTKVNTIRWIAASSSAPSITTIINNNKHLRTSISLTILNLDGTISMVVARGWIAFHLFSMLPSTIYWSSHNLYHFELDFLLQKLLGAVIRIE